MQGSLRTSNNIRPGLFPQKCLCTSLQIWLELNVVWRTEQRFFRYNRGLRPSHLMNLLQTKLAKSCESYLVEFSLFCTGLTLPSLKLFLMLYSGLPVFLFFSYLQNLISQLLSYNHHSNFQGFWQFFEKPMIEVCMLMLSRSEAFLCWEGLSFMLIITKKNKKKNSINSG